MLGRDFPQVNANTVAAFALGVYEWLLSFEADDLHDLVDMMRHLRYSKARLHVRDELPFHTGRRLAATADVAALLACTVTGPGRGRARAAEVSAWSAAPARRPRQTLGSHHHGYITQTT